MDKTRIVGEIAHPAFYHLSPESKAAAKVTAGHAQVILHFEKASEVQRASDELRDWDDSGTKYEHHVRDGGYVVLDWD